jgi:hypothetical protein
MTAAPRRAVPEHGELLFAPVVGNQPEVANAVKATGQYMQQKRRMNSSALSVMVLWRGLSGLPLSR